MKGGLEGGKLAGEEGLNRGGGKGGGGEEGANFELFKEVTVGRAVDATAAFLRH
jgi:hypothetical protein